MAWNKNIFFPILGTYLEFKGQILTEEFTVDLGSGLCWGKPEVPCLQPVTTVVFQFY
jgi:hypothetical protein